MRPLRSLGPRAQPHERGRRGPDPRPAPPPHETETETELAGTSTGSEATHAEIEEQHMEVLGGAPPAWDEAQDVEPVAEPPDAKPDLHVDFERLEQLTIKHPPYPKLLATKAGRHGGLHVIVDLDSDGPA